MEVHVLVVSQLRESRPVLAELFAHETVKLVGARYDLDTGRVELVA